MLVHLEVLAVLLGQLAALGSLFDRQADPATGEIEIDDLDPQLFARGDDLLGRVHVVGAHLADVDETLDAFANLRERTERHELGDPAVDQLTDLVTAGEDLPWVLLGGLEREADSFAIEVDIEHLDSDGITDGDNGTRMIDVLPRQLADVDESVHTAEIDESTETDDAADDTGTNFSRLEVGEELVAGFLLRLFEIRTTAEHHVVAVLVQFDDLGLDHLADIRLQIADTAQLDKRRRQEAAQSDVDDETTLDDFDHEPLDHAVGFLQLLDVAPGTLVLSALFGQQQTSLFVFLLEDERFDLLAELDDVARIDIVANAELAGEDDTLALVTDVEQHLVAVDLDHGAVHQLAVFDFNERAGNCVGEGHAKVVGDDLAGGVIALFVKGAKGSRRGRRGIGQKGIRFQRRTGGFVQQATRRE